MPRITKRQVDSLRTAHGRDRTEWDSTLPGFGVRVRPSGLRYYVVKYRNAAGRQRWETIGRHGELTPDQARRRAEEIRASVRAGEDPAALRRSKRKAPTLEALCDRYLEEHARPHKKPRSVAEDERMVRTFLKPFLGREKVADIGRTEVARLHRQIGRKTPTQANRVLFLLSTLLNLAAREGLRPEGSNPCRHVPRFKERRRDRYLSEEELARLGGVLAELEAAYVRGKDPRREISELPAVCNAVRLLALTGLRRGEILGLRWEDVDLANATVTLRDSKTGPRTALLYPPALALLSRLPHLGPWVIPGLDADEPLVGLPHAWERIRILAKLEDVRLHDLRHTFASFGVAAGLSLPVIGALLGHREVETTQRYAHLSADPLRTAGGLTSARIAAALDGTPSAPVIPIAREHA